MTEEEKRQHKSEVFKVWREANMPRVRELWRRWAESNPEKIQERAIRAGIRRRDATARAGGLKSAADIFGPCDICGQECERRFDHDHETGAFRGWLCHGCNVALGHFRDDPEILMAAVEYLLRG